MLLLQEGYSNGGRRRNIHKQSQGITTILSPSMLVIFTDFLLILHFSLNKFARMESGYVLRVDLSSLIFITPFPC